MRTIAEILRRDQENKARLRLCSGLPLPSEALQDAYFAGLLDGEGSIFLRLSGKGKCHSLCTQITNNHVGVLEELQSIYGGHYSTFRNKKYNSNGAEWQAASRLAYDFLKKVSPYLRIKQGEARLGLEFYETFFLDQFTYRMTADLWERREVYRKQIQGLHQAGGGHRKDWSNPYV